MASCKHADQINKQTQNVKNPVLKYKYPIFVTISLLKLFTALDECREMIVGWFNKNVTVPAHVYLQRSLIAL